MNLLPKRSKAAFILSGEVLFERNPKLYFWTFTWPSAMPYWCYRQSWDRFIHSVVQRYTAENFEALRVWERHPGGHGLHVHMLCNERLDVNLMRGLAERSGLGRVLHVRKAQAGDIKYLTKYMTKEGAIDGLRVWAKLGHWEHVKGDDLKFESAEANDWRTDYRAGLARGMNKEEAYRYATICKQQTVAQRAKEWAHLSRDKATSPQSTGKNGVDVTTVWATGVVEKS